MPHTVRPGNTSGSGSGRFDLRAAVIRRLRVYRVLALILVDSLAWIAAMLLSTSLRLETWQTSEALHVSGSAGTIPLYGVLAIGTAAAVLHAALAWAVRLHQGRSGLGSFEEIFVLASVLVVVGAAITTFNALAPSAYVPRTTPVVATLIALILCAWPRGLWRMAVAQAKPNRFGVVPTPVLIVGAGEAARQLVQSMQRDPNQQWQPLGFVDDDKRKRHFRYRGISVLGRTEDLATAASKVDADTVVIAIPSANAGTVIRINDLAREAGLKVKVLPGVNELLAGVNHSALRDIEPADFLGRHQIETDVTSIAGYLTGKRVLVTGAGGSIGSELCRQIAKFGPAELMLLDRDESALHGLLLSMRGRADLESSDCILGNIRELDRMHEIFEDRRPEVVFHAAALKHVNMLETHASEAVKTNVLGTLNLLEAAHAVGVKRFVNISTDKAADPVNVLGYTKRIAEGLTSAFASTTDGTYLSVRFGNVLGTRGSVLTTFAAQIKSGAPITVTDPEVTRYFMTVDEAVQLVIQAAAIGRDGEALVLDMGEPVKIADMARQLAQQANKPIEIVYTGLKPGEKLHEVLLGEGEEDFRPVHPLVSHVGVPLITRDDAKDLPAGRDNEMAVKALRQMSERMRLDDPQKASR